MLLGRALGVVVAVVEAAVAFGRQAVCCCTGGTGLVDCGLAMIRKRMLASFAPAWPPRAARRALWGRYEVR